MNSFKNRAAKIAAIPAGIYLVIRVAGLVPIVFANMMSGGSSIDTMFSQASASLFCAGILLFVLHGLFFHGTAKTHLLLPVSMILWALSEVISICGNISFFLSFNGFVLSLEGILESIKHYGIIPYLTYTLNLVFVILPILVLVLEGFLKNKQRVLSIIAVSVLALHGVLVSFSYPLTSIASGYFSMINFALQLAYLLWILALVIYWSFSSNADPVPNNPNSY